VAVYVLPKEALRVVAIGVQGLMNRSPGKSATFLLRDQDQGDRGSQFPRSIEVAVYEIDDFYKIVSILMQKKIDETKGSTLLAYATDRKQWYDATGLTYDDFARWPKKTQKEAEAAAAIAFTAPYRVEHVTNEAQATALTITDRWRGWR